MASKFWWVVFVAAIGCGQHEHGGMSGDPSGDNNAGCGLVTCESAGATCGPVGDGCGGVIDCGTCAAPDTCGGGGVPFTCGNGDNFACTPRTCADAGAECGVVANGCGTVTASCGTCPTGSTCGGGGVPNKCAEDPPCTGLCLQQDACTNMTPTTITGKVTAPGHADTATWGEPDPIYGALVYVPNGAAGAPTWGVTPFTAGVSCESCNSQVSGSPLVSAVTAVDGTFTVMNAPCGTDIPLVIQLGRWRRQITIPAVECCASTTLTNAQTHLPRNQLGEPGDIRSDIPLMAFSTGNKDTLHCVLRKVGLDDSEFTNPDGTGRVHFYVDNGAKIDNATPAASTLYGDAAALAKYDMTLFECVGNRVAKGDADQQRVVDYANAGGRVFATHFSYVWLTDSDGAAGTNTGPGPFFKTADWDVNQGNFNATTGLVDMTEQGDPATQARRVAFADWLHLVGASTTLGEIPVTFARKDFNSVSPAQATAARTPAQQWLSTTEGFPIHYTFDTPVSYAPDPVPTTQCGRVLFSDFHVIDAKSAGTVFPAECSTGPMTPQEKTIEFMLFDLASCVGPPLGKCEPKTCSQFGYECGQAGTGCDDGVVLDCGYCPEGQTCGAGGINKCGTGVCTPRTCASAGAQCGVIGDGCGGTLDCGSCEDGSPCGNGGANQCGGVIL